MQINLKQSEITDALRQYVTQQGINLTGKTVDIAFTAGRKEGGLSAEITIDDQDIPGYSNDVKQGQLTLVQPEAEPTEESTPVVQAEPQESPVTEAPKTTSLFS
jgi:hypothetical protein